MEGIRSSKLYSTSNNRVSHTFSAETTSKSTKSKKRSSSHVRFRRNVCNHTTNETTRGPRGSRSISELRVIPFSGIEERRYIPSHIQPTSTELLCTNRSFSVDKHVPCPGVPPGSRLDVQGRFVTGVFPPTDSAVAQTISASSLQRRIAPNDLPSFRFKYGTQGFRLYNELDSSNSPRKRCENNCLLRRFSNRKPKSPCHSSACRYASGNTGVSRIPSKLREICSYSAKTNNIPRNCLVALDKSKGTASRKIGFYTQESFSGFRNRPNHTDRASKSGRPVKFCQLCGPSREAKSPSYPQFSKHPERVQNFNKLRTSPNGNGRNALVGSKLSSRNFVTCSPANTFSNHGCLRYSLGCTTEQSGFVRRLECRGTIPTLQCEGATSHLKSPRIPLKIHDRRFGAHSIRQSFCGSVSPQRGREQVPITHEPNTSNPLCPGPSSDISQNLSHSREVQQPRGLLIQTPPNLGMAFTSELHRDDLRKAGDACHRPVCVQDSSSIGELHHPRPQRSRSDVSRRLQPEVEFPTSMGFSATVSHTPSIDAPQPSVRSLFDCSSPVGESFLAGRPQIAGNHSSLHLDESETVSSRHDDRTATSQSSGDGLGNLEMWGWSQKIKTWDSNQISLLKSSWRPSTLQTYKTPWNRWLSWSKQHTVNPLHPEGSELAQFLADLHLKFKFSYSTILLHKSVVSTLCNADLSGKLSEDVFVRHILKSISLKNLKSPKPPVWDINALTTFMSNYSVNSTNVFQTVRHTAALLSLCSGRRIHDLTLLSVDSEHCTIEDDYIVLWPQFGSKTDCREYRQSGWKLLVNTQNQNLNPVFWINKTISVLSERRGASGLSNLFITLRGSPSPASRTVIAGWFKSLLKAANITATPGSVRSAVASRNWIDNCPLDEILERGNWKSARTFQNYYRREVMGSFATNSAPISTLFHPVH